MKVSHILAALFFGGEALAEVFTRLHPDGSIAEVRVVESMDGGFDDVEPPTCKSKTKKKGKCKCVSHP